ncbi:hypothetical protein SAMN06265340_101299 [Desulfurobacterium atlanticum]|uniref:SMODS-associated and fused to various effectors domain-containing protein n=2 Tax=Desulfurobacterium atlanticum TaxID=240169 RepID=A0A238XV58_9BACT|nr:hypothetical protein SAMN06265340_101299 [Desulfurobacterium atlanticum]
MKFDEYPVDIVIEFVREGRTIPFEENEEYIREIFLGESVTDKHFFLQNLLLFRLLDEIPISEIEKVMAMEIVDVKHFEFPAISVSNKQNDCVLRGKIVYTSKPPKRNSFLVDNNVIRACKTFKSLFNTKNFILVFDGREFTGTSFMLSVVVAHFFSQKLFEYFMFTGEVLPSGKINKVDSILEKKKLAQRYGKKLISPEDVSSIEEVDFWLNESKPLPVPFSVMIKKNNDGLKLLESAIKEREPLFSLKNLEVFFEIKREDISILHSGFLSENYQEWLAFVHRIREQLRKLFSNEKLVELKKPVINLICSESIISFVIGVLVGTKKRVVFHSYNRGDNVYVPSMETDDSLRSLDFPGAEFCGELIDYEYFISDKNKNVLPVIIDMAPTTRIEYDVKEFLKKNRIENFIVIKIDRDKIKNYIPEDTNIRKKLVKEIYNLLNCQTFKKFSKLWFFMNLPVDIAFGLGSTFQDTRMISLFKFFPGKKDKYVEVLNVSPGPSPGGVKSIF